MKGIKATVLVVPSSVSDWAKSFASTRTMIGVPAATNHAIACADKLALDTDPSLVMWYSPSDDKFSVRGTLFIGNTYNHLGSLVHNFPQQMKLDLASCLFQAKSESRSLSYVVFRKSLETGLTAKAGVILNDGASALNHELAHLQPVLRAAYTINRDEWLTLPKDTTLVLGKQGISVQLQDDESMDDFTNVEFTYENDYRSKVSAGRLLDVYDSRWIDIELSCITSGSNKHCAGVLFDASANVGDSLYRIIVFGAHSSIKTTCNVIPVIGYPGTGYESVMRGLASFGYATECRDEMGYRVYSELENHWDYKPDFVLAKARQYSETRPWTIFWSIGGDNVLDLLSMAWPVIVVIDPIPVSVWKTRVNEWRAKNAPELGEVVEAEIKRYESEISRWKMVIERSVSNVVRISGNLTPDGIAAAIISNLRPIVPLTLAPKFDDANVIIAGPTVGKSYAAQVAGYFDIQNSKYACESAFKLWDRPYEVAHAAHMVAQRRRRLQGIFVPLLCAPFFPNAPVYYRDAEDLTIAAIRRGDTSDQIKRELAYQAADLDMIRDHHKGRLTKLRANEFISDVLQRNKEKSILTNTSSVEWLADSMATAIMPFLQRYEGAWRNPKNGSTRVVFSRDLDQFVVIKTISTKVMTVKFWNGSLDVTKSFWNTTQAFDPGIEGMSELFLNLQRNFSVSDEATKALIAAAQRTVAAVQLPTKSESDLEKKEE